MSPAWWVGVPARPWGLPVGLKCPPALLASAALQSPFSCTWMAWVWPAPRPPIWPVMCTPSPIGAIDSLPLTRLPEADARLTVAELAVLVPGEAGAGDDIGGRTEEHTSEIQSLMSISYAVFCLNKKNI